MGGECGGERALMFPAPPIARPSAGVIAATAAVARRELAKEILLEMIAAGHDPEESVDRAFAIADRMVSHGRVGS